MTCSDSQVKIVSPEELIGSLNDVEKKYAPKKLYSKGDLGLMEHPRVSIIGTRNPSESAKEHAYILSSFLVRNSVVVVSGLAAGIDSIAHQTAIEKKGKTIAVLGNPLDTYYPKQNTVLQNEILKNHLAISQFPVGTPTQRKNFPMRNRTMALLSHISVIVEARDGSGTIHQGWEALRLGRPLFIVQGKGLSWAEKLMEYGAQVLPISDVRLLLESLPQVPVVMNCAPF